MNLILLLYCLVQSAFIDAGIFRHDVNSQTHNCGYEKCPIIDPHKLNVHLVPHTHDDVGWLKTVDQYYYGSNSTIQLAGVQYIIDNVIAALRRDPERRFIYVETAFLWKWWQRQNEKTHEEVRSFINEGRLEIIGGAWSMNDEATTHYQSTIDQFTWGFRRLNDTFGACARPKIGWQIDPFGHSREQASLFAQFGFDGLFFGRLDYQDKSQRLKDKTAEFIWHGSSSLGKKADLFTGILYNHYSAPPGFCFDVLCRDTPLIDDPKSPDNNIKSRINVFVDYIVTQAKHYQTNNIILTMGEDFTYQQSEMYFMNLDKLIKYTNELNGTTVNAFYSTPSCYVKSLYDSNKTWTTKVDDFFPYSSDPHAFWTGYFTSRPTLKFYERMGNNLLQIVKQLSVMSHMMDSEALQDFRETMGVMQHHDAVTGTEKQHVAADYARLLHDSMLRGETIVSAAMSKLVAKNTAPTEFHSCSLLNSSTCAFTERSDSFVVTLYNPTSQLLSTNIRIPVKGKGYTVKDATGNELTVQLLPIPEQILKMPGRESNATSELVFRAVEIPALGYKSYEIRAFASSLEVERPAAVSSIDNKFYNVGVNNNGGVVIQWKNIDMHVVQTFQYYEGSKGNNSEAKHRASGAYIFRPNESVIHNFAYNGTYQYFTGPLVNELRITVNNFTSEIVRIHNDDETIEFDWVIGPIPVNDSIGREIVTRYSSNLESKGAFYTDSNAREMLKRVRNFRPTWSVKLEEPIAGNYYPVTAKISLQDEEKGLRLSVLNDRAQGGSSLNDGELEVMLHRRLLNDDAFGVGEALNEQAFGTGLVARGTHYLLGSSFRDPTKLRSTMLKEKYLAVELAHRPWPLFTPLNQWQPSYAMQMSGLQKQLSPSIQVLTLEPWKNGEILLRLEHMFEAGEAADLSQPVEVNIMDLFTNFNVIAVRETTLGGNQWIEEMNRLKWQTQYIDNEIDEDVTSTPIEIHDGVINVLLEPMEIRTFIIRYDL